MRNNVDSAPASRPRLTLEPSKPFPFVVSRLLEDELPVLSPWLWPIRRDYLHEMLVYTPEERYLLPCVFLAAEDLFGRSSQSFDFYKCSFKFPLFLSATKEGRPVRYAMLLEDVRGSVTLPFFRLYHERRSEDAEPHDPLVDGELSRADINAITDFFLGYLYGYGEALAKHARSFHRVVRSERLVYGNRAGDLFEKVLGDHDEDAFHRAIDAIEADLAEEEARHERADLERLLGCIQRGEIRM